MSVEKALLRDPYYRRAAEHFSHGELVEAGFIPNNPDAPFPEAVTWPSLSFDCIARALASGEGRPVVLLTTGSFAPVHEGHLAMMAAARAALEARGEWVVGGVISPSHDAYVSTKGDGQEAWPAARRLGEIARLIEDHDWLTTDSWEALGVGVAVNFTDVIARLEAHLFHLFKRSVEVVYVFGGDNLAFMRTFIGMGRGVCVCRPGYRMAPEPWFDERHLVVTSPLERDISSTQKRKEKDRQQERVARGNYVIRNDWPMIADYWGVDIQSVDPVPRIEACLGSGLPAGDIGFQRVDIQVQREWVREQLLSDTRPVVSLDTFYRPSHTLDVSRRFSCSHDQRFAHALCSRPEASQSLAEQAQAVPSGEVVLVDDDSVSGATLRFVKDLLGPRVTIARTVFLADALALSDVYDVVDVRDFLLGAPFGGLVVSDPTGAPMRVPYMAPYVNLETRARLDGVRALAVSLALWRWNVEVMGTMHQVGASLPVTDALVRFAALSGHSIDAKMPFLSLQALAQWHVDRLEGV